MTRTFIPSADMSLWTAIRDTYNSVSWVYRDGINLRARDRSALTTSPHSELSEERVKFIRDFAALVAEMPPSQRIAVKTGDPFPAEDMVRIASIDGVHIGTPRDSRATPPPGAEMCYGYIAHGRWVDGEPSDQNADLQIIPLTGWGDGFVAIRPSEERLADLPETVRRMASRTIPRATMGTSPMLRVEDDGQVTMVDWTPVISITADEIIADARAAWRDRITARMRTSAVDDDFERRRTEHRNQTQQNWQRFVESRAADTEQLVGTLPFVPHGLASSRRWGIEVESGGARGVDAPDSWRAISDGSLRSAYDGYVEVEDFEPFDREETYLHSWVECETQDHNPRVEMYDSIRQEHIWVANPNYSDPRECSDCGRRTRTVRVEPQTIRHHAQAGDCREFVSPILTSMHSNGLEQLCEALSKNPQNDTAGVHVHVESDDLTDQQIATLVYGYGLLEPILEASYRRTTRQYCQPRSHGDVLSAGRVASRGGSFDRDGASRYVTVNTQALGEHGTIEFRAMGAVYEYDYLVRWAMLCRELVNVVAAGATTRDFAKVKSWQDLLNLLTMFGKEYVRASVYELTGEVGEVAKLEKAGEPVTSEALDADLNSAWETITAAFRRMAHNAESVRARLVTVGGTSET